ncbi:RNA polymerase sigma factor [Caulobacter sp. UNC279MFTsu5.1]|uniref:RNA polymerase sigma factor n=1 Tax=Caulobacter sp. UNC279MFTsu5.1 TaxID=1502775 RepID=UPI000372792C|nr:sigma-70 family RNA polymerase sigma factor [Caulobacter sp. UNC279MFTsu5.1]SFI74400.1 RNA polymerase sigma-70 factor, ECF subfamily [Caulobacter sp. UNC279MFTsu5.1]
MDSFQTQMLTLLPRLRRMARVLAWEPADADDLTQLTVERALLRRDQWRPGTRLDSWMFRIMRNAWIDEARARQRRGRVLAPPEAGALAADPSAPSLDARLEATAVERALDALPEDQRIAVALVLIEGLSYQEAADSLEVPIGTLTSRLARGRATLQTALIDQGAPP